MARIMIAEDDVVTRNLLEDSLRIGQHELVAEAKDGIEAVEKFNATNPDVLLLDVFMPRKDGLSALKEIISSNPDAKIIMLTADESFSTIKQSTEAGAQAYLSKPFDFEDVLKAITMVLR